MTMVSEGVAGGGCVALAVVEGEQGGGARDAGGSRESGGAEGTAKGVEGGVSGGMAGDVGDHEFQGPALAHGPSPMADGPWAILGRRDVRGKGQGDEDDKGLAVPLARPGAPALGGDTVPGSMYGTRRERSFAVGCAGAGACAPGRCLRPRKVPAPRRRMTTEWSSMSA
jgi:hypothetical protein